MTPGPTLWGRLPASSAAHRTTANYPIVPARSDFSASPCPSTGELARVAYVRAALRCDTSESASFEAIVPPLDRRLRVCPRDGGHRWAVSLAGERGDRAGELAVRHEDP